MIKNYRNVTKTNLVIRIIAGFCFLIGVFFFALSTPFLILAIAFIGLAFLFTAILN